MRYMWGSSISRPYFQQLYLEDKICVGRDLSLNSFGSIGHLCWHVHRSFFAQRHHFHTFIPTGNHLPNARGELEESVATRIEHFPVFKLSHVLDFHAVSRLRKVQPVACSLHGLSHARLVSHSSPAFPSASFPVFSSTCVFRRRRRIFGCFGCFHCTSCAAAARVSQR